MLPFPDYQDHHHVFAKPFAEQLKAYPNQLVADANYSWFASPEPILYPDDLLLFPSPSSLDVLVRSTTAAPLMLPAAAAVAAVTSTQASEEKSSSCVGRRVRRKDRHSKIVTARGPRDRRMRLSIEVAGKFFQLQDMLGFDKASKTVQWLLTMSASAIRDLAAAFATSVVQSPYSTESSTLAYEDYHSSAGAHGPKSMPSAAAATANDEALTDHREASKSKKKHKTETTCRKKTEFHSATARQSRAKARERAKERAVEKRRFMSSFSDAMKVKEEETKSAQAIERSYHLITTTAAGGPLVAMPLYGNTQLEPGGPAAIILKTDGAGVGVFRQPTWDMEAISYSR